MSPGVIPALWTGAPPTFLFTILMATIQVPRREKVDIISAILSMVAEGVTAKTHLMYRSNLDSRALKKYIKLMVEKGLLSLEKDDHESYHLTEKGRDFLQRYKGLEMLLD